MHKLMIPKLVARILNQFNKGDKKTPRMWSVNNKSFKQNSGDLLLDGLSVGFCKQIQERAGEIVSVAVGISELIGNCVQEQVSTFRI